MPVEFLHRLTTPVRTRGANRQLGGVLAFVAGAINAGGFLAVQRYTSHMTGIVSAIADDLVLGQLLLAMAGVSSLLAFVLGAATTAVLVNWARRRRLHGEFALPLALEAALLLLFGLLGANLELLVDVFVPSTVLLLCFVMGLQNAIVTKISQAEIRTTHMTGVITDLGIELGRLFYWNRTPEANARHMVVANREKLRVHLAILALFFIGGLVGAVAFKRIGFAATVPFAALLTAMAAPPLLRDLRQGVLA
ncbi:YoaK family protein [Caldimonas sp. KR1-144]|uniref:YoaK family protein n=1 Tax=Caldimonas sp. KR1-144 TaxID=3400911 RepID=UPI003BFD59A8